jgi:hypothetical protein
MNNFQMVGDYLKKFTYRMRYGKNGRQMRVYPDDSFLVGYPKSGNTWLDFLVAGLRAEQAEDVNFETIEKKYVADIYFNDARKLNQLGRPRFLKSHEYFDSRYPKAVCIVRDPRAVVVSYYHHFIGTRKYEEDYPLENFVSEFMRGECDHFGTWEKHVRGWLNAQQRAEDRVMLVRYEDIKLNTERELKDIATFLRLNATDEKIRSAEQWAKPENMRRIEVEARKANKPEFATFTGNRFFVRKAVSDGWQQELGLEQQKKIEDAWGGVMSELGYF